MNEPRATGSRFQCDRGPMCQHIRSWRLFLGPFWTEACLLIAGQMLPAFHASLPLHSGEEDRTPRSSLHAPPHGGFSHRPTSVTAASPLSWPRRHVPLGNRLPLLHKFWKSRVLRQSLPWIFSCFTSLPSPQAFPGYGSFNF